MEALMMQGQGGGAPGGGGQQPSQETGPAGGAATTPMQPKGAEAMADVKVGQALKMLRDAYGVYPFGAEKSKALGEVLGKMAKLFPEQQTQPLQNAQMAQLMTKLTPSAAAQ